MTDEHEFNSCDSPDCTKIINFGNVAVGSKVTKALIFRNQYEESQNYQVKACNRKGIIDYPFSIDNEAFVIRPKAKFTLLITFNPGQTFQHYYDHFYVKTNHGKDYHLYLRGETTGPYVVSSHSEIVLRTTLRKAVESFFVLTNHSDCAADVHFEVDNTNSAFRVYPLYSSIAANSKGIFEIKFIPQFEGSVEKELFCLIKNQEPLVINAVGLCCRQQENNAEPQLTRHPLFTPLTWKVNATEAYIHRRWEDVMRINPNHIIRVPPGESSTKFEVENLSPAACLLVWQEESLKNFKVIPSVKRVQPFSKELFKVCLLSTTYHTRDTATEKEMKCGVGNWYTLCDSTVTAILDGWLFWEDNELSFTFEENPYRKCQDYDQEMWKSSRVPINIAVTLIGQPVTVGESPSSAIVIPEVVQFPRFPNRVYSFSTFIIKKNSTGPVLFNLHPPKNTKFTARPMEGVIVHDFQVVVVLFSNPDHDTYLESWNISLNGTERNMISIMFTSMSDTLNIMIEDGAHEIEFPPVLLGDFQEKKVIVHNASSIWAKVSHDAEEISQSIVIGPSECILAPNEQLVQNWRCCPTHLGLSSILVHFEAIQVKSPRLEELEEIIRRSNLPRYDDIPVGEESADKFLTAHESSLHSNRIEFNILVNITCSGNSLRMHPRELYNKDYVMTWPAKSLFLLFNAGDADNPYTLCLHHEPVAEESAGFNVDPAQRVNNQFYEIKPNHGLLAPGESVTIQCTICCPTTEPQKYSIVAYIVQACKGGSIHFEQNEAIPPKKLGFITCQGAWPHVNITDVKSSEDDDFNSKFTLWKMLNIDSLNKALVFQYPPLRESIHMTFPERPLHFPVVEYYFQLQNLSPLPMKWVITLTHNELLMPQQSPMQEESNTANCTQHKQEALNHLRELIEAQQKKAILTQDEGQLMKIECCPIKEPTEWTNEGRRVPATTKKCPLGTVIEIMPQQGFLKPGGAEMLKLSILHELQGAFTFSYSLTVALADVDIENEIRTVNCQTLARLGRSANTEKSLAIEEYHTDHLFQKESTSEFGYRISDRLYDALHKFHSEPKLPALMRTQSYSDNCLQDIDIHKSSISQHIATNVSTSPVNSTDMSSDADILHHPQHEQQLEETNDKHMPEFYSESYSPSDACNLDVKPFKITVVNSDSLHLQHPLETKSDLGECSTAMYNEQFKKLMPLPRHSVPLQQIKSLSISHKEGLSADIERTALRDFLTSDLLSSSDSENDCSIQFKLSQLTTHCNESKSMENASESPKLSLKSLKVTTRGRKLMDDKNKPNSPKSLPYMHDKSPVCVSLDTKCITKDKEGNNSVPECQMLSSQTFSPKPSEDVLWSQNRLQPISQETVTPKSNLFSTNNGEDKLTSESDHLCTAQRPCSGILPVIELFRSAEGFEIQEHTRYQKYLRISKTPDRNFSEHRSTLQEEEVNSDNKMMQGGVRGRKGTQTKNQPNFIYKSVSGSIEISPRTLEMMDHECLRYNEKHVLKGIQSSESLDHTHVNNKGILDDDQQFKGISSERMERDSGKQKIGATLSTTLESVSDTGIKPPGEMHMKPYHQQNDGFLIETQEYHLERKLPNRPEFQQTEQTMYDAGKKFPRAMQRKTSPASPLPRSTKNSVDEDSQDANIHSHQTMYIPHPPPNSQDSAANWLSSQQANTIDSSSVPITGSEEDLCTNSGLSIPKLKSSSDPMILAKSFMEYNYKFPRFSCHSHSAIIPKNKYRVNQFISEEEKNFPEISGTYTKLNGPEGEATVSYPSLPSFSGESRTSSDFSDGFSDEEDLSFLQRSNKVLACDQKLMTEKGEKAMMHKTVSLRNLKHFRRPFWRQWILAKEVSDKMREQFKLGYRAEPQEVRGMEGCLQDLCLHSLYKERQKALSKYSFRYTHLSDIPTPSTPSTTTDTCVSCPEYMTGGTEDTYTVNNQETSTHASDNACDNITGEEKEIKRGEHEITGGDHKTTGGDQENMSRKRKVRFTEYENDGEQPAESVSKQNKKSSVWSEPEKILDGKTSNKMENASKLAQSQEEKSLNVSHLVLTSVKHIPCEDSDESQGSVHDLCSARSYKSVDFMPDEECGRQRMDEFLCKVTEELKTYETCQAHSCGIPYTKKLHHSKSASCLSAPWRRDQMIFDHLDIKTLDMPNEPAASIFNLCSADSYTNIGPNTASCGEQLDPNIIMFTDLVSAMNSDTFAKHTSKSHLIPSSYSEISLGEHHPSKLDDPQRNERPFDGPGNAPEQKVWNQPLIPIVKTVDLKLTVSTFCEKADTAAHPTTYADKMVMADVSIHDNDPPIQVTWLYNPHPRKSAAYAVEDIVNQNKKHRNNTFKCINQRGVIFPRSISPLIMQFQPMDIGLHKGSVFLSLEGANALVQIEGKGVEHNVVDFQNTQPLAPRISLIEGPEFPLMMSDERIVVPELMPMSCKIHRLAFMVNRTNKPVHFNWKSLLQPSLLDSLIDVNVQPNQGILSPFEVLPLIVVISKVKKQSCMQVLRLESDEKMNKNQTFSMYAMSSNKRLSFKRLPTRHDNPILKSSNFCGVQSAPGMMENMAGHSSHYEQHEFTVSSLRFSETNISEEISRRETFIPERVEAIHETCRYSNAPLYVDWYPLNCKVTCVDSDEEEPHVTEEDYYATPKSAKTRVYHKPLNISFGMCHDSAQDNDSDTLELPTPCGDEIVYYLPGVVPVTQSGVDLPESKMIDNRQLITLFGDLLEGSLWNLLDSKWYSVITKKILREGRTQRQKRQDVWNENSESSSEDEPLYYNQVVTTDRIVRRDNDLQLIAEEELAAHLFERPSEWPEHGIVEIYKDFNLIAIKLGENKSLLIHPSNNIDILMPERVKEILPYTIPPGLTTEFFEQSILRHTLSCIQNIFSPSFDLKEHFENIITEDDNAEE